MFKDAQDIRPAFRLLEAILHIGCICQGGLQEEVACQCPGHVWIFNSVLQATSFVISSRALQSNCHPSHSPGRLRGPRFR